MNNQQLDDEAILEVARQIHSPGIRAKYLSQVCKDDRQLGRLEGRLMSGRRWQFSLRTLLVAMLVLGCLAGGVAILSQPAIRARNAELMARELTIEAQKQAELARAAQMAAEVAAAQTDALDPAAEQDDE